MKKTYTSFNELAEAMKNGSGTLHLFNCEENKHKRGDCMSWMAGIDSFAKWLDHLQINVEVSDEQEGFYLFSD